VSDAYRSVPLGPLRGRIRVPGDKSVSHRALILGGLALGRTRVRGLLDAEDVRATASAMRACGVQIDEDADGIWVTGGAVGEPPDVVDCGNSGTSMRLLAGVFAARPGLAVLTGDASLRRRPMARIVAPLRQMGASIDARDAGRLAPLCIRGGQLRATSLTLSVASAQVKSCVLLAGLASGVDVSEPRTSRDHTERLLRAMGAAIHTEGDRIVLQPSTLQPVNIDVPADISAAAFLMVAASLVPGSELVLEGVGVNPTRTGVLDVLLAMGADITVAPEPDDGIEPRATVVVRHAALHGVHIRGDLALRSLDELPVLAVAAAFATGPTTIADAAELRVKESDRIARVAAGIRALGGEVHEQPDGMTLAGGGLRGGGTVDASGDHRLAMAFTVAGLVAPRGAVIESPQAVRSSWPTFFTDLVGLAPQGSH
jgi:3-phosphoshikimate 1-carboxyvinyltransferase